MTGEYDIYVDCDYLTDLEERLMTINNALNGASEQMISAVNYSQGFLSGRQFENAKEITKHCVNNTSQTCDNILKTIQYLEELKTVLEEYEKCRYPYDGI